MARKFILHVEDSPDDALLVEYAFSSAAPEMEVRRVETGEQAIEFLKTAVSTPEERRPDLLLLDLKLQGISGFDVLAWVRAAESLKNLPVVVLSGSPLESDQVKALKMGATSYQVKSTDYRGVAREVLRLCSGAINSDCQLFTGAQE